MRVRSKIVAALLTAAACVPASEPLDVYLCAGQSNMAGAAVPEEMPPELLEPQREIWMFSGNEWIPLQPGKRIGPEISFAVELQKELDKPIGIIKHAIGGKNLAEDWNPDLPQSLYAQLKQMVDAAGQARDIRVAGLIWMQGESDSRSEEMARAYATNLENLIRRARRDFGNPDMAFVAGRVNPPVRRFPFAEMVRTAQASCSVSGYSFVDCDDLPKNPDNLHYNTEGLIDLGRRFAREMLRFVH